MTMVRKRFKRRNSFKFKPFSVKQKQLLTWWTDGSPHYLKDTIICHGAIRSGKTIAMIDSFMMWSLNKHRSQNFIIASKSMGALKRNVLEPLFEILTAKGIDYHYHMSENPHLKIGTNTYYLFGANNESSQDTLQGLTAAGCYLDEVALFPRSFVEQAIGRCSAVTEFINGIIEYPKKFMNCNPEGAFHWFKTDYIDKAEEKNILVLHFTMDDNLSLSERVKETFRRTFSGVFYQRNILGLWVMAQGVIYDMFDYAKHVLKKLPPLEKNNNYVSIDYGTQNATVFLLWQKGKDGIWYCTKEYYYSGRDNQLQKTDKEFANDLEDFIGNLPIREIIIDPSAASFIAEIKQRGFKVRPADNSVVDGIRFTGSMISQGRIKFISDCKNLIKEFSAYLWDEKATNRGEDKPLKEHDHAMDAMRYFVYTVLGKGSSVSFLT